MLIHVNNATTALGTFHRLIRDKSSILENNCFPLTALFFFFFARLLSSLLAARNVYWPTRVRRPVVVAICGVLPAAVLAGTHEKKKENRALLFK